MYIFFTKVSCKWVKRWNAAWSCNGWLQGSTCWYESPGFKASHKGPRISARKEDFPSWIETVTCVHLSCGWDCSSNDEAREFRHLCKHQGKQSANWIGWKQKLVTTRGLRVAGIHGRNGPVCPWMSLRVYIITRETSVRWRWGNQSLSH